MGVILADLKKEQVAQFNMFLDLVKSLAISGAIPTAKYEDLVQGAKERDERLYGIAETEFWKVFSLPGVGMFAVEKQKKEE